MQSISCIIKKTGIIVIPVLVKPNSRQSQITEINSEWIGVSVAAPPHDGEANKELCEYIASVLPGIKKRQVSVRTATQRSRNKILEVETDLPLEQVTEALLQAYNK
jgi:uncharacterized protein